MAVQRCQCTIPSPQGDPPPLISIMIFLNQTQWRVCAGAGAFLGRGAGQGVHVSDWQDDGGRLKDRRRLRRVRQVWPARQTGLDCRWTARGISHPLDCLCPMSHLGDPCLGCSILIQTISFISKLPWSHDDRVHVREKQDWNKGGQVNDAAAGAVGHDDELRRGGHGVSAFKCVNLLCQSAPCPPASFSTYNYIPLDHFPPKDTHTLHHLF